MDILLLSLGAYYWLFFIIAYSLIRLTISLIILLAYGVNDWIHLLLFVKLVSGLASCFTIQANGPLCMVFLNQRCLMLLVFKYTLELFRMVLVVQVVGHFFVMFFYIKTYFRCCCYWSFIRQKYCYLAVPFGLLPIGVFGHIGIF